MKVLTIIGTRPEAVKMAPVIAELNKQSSVTSRVLITGQHREMLEQVLRVFGIKPDYDLNVMRPNQTPADVLAAILFEIQPVLNSFAPDWVLVQGDTTTVLAAAIGAVYAGLRVGHVEAGLRTNDRQNPFPEEINRVLVDHISDLHFAPTELSHQALLREGIPENSIFITGNTVIDALNHIIDSTNPNFLPDIPEDKRIILVTAHRRENHGKPLHQIFSALRLLAERRDIHIVYPVHYNPQVWKPAHEMLAGFDNITLLRPLDYLSFVWLMKRSFLILTDSGGIQEEAPSFGVPVLVLRAVTERQEVIQAGVAKLVGTETDDIVNSTRRLLDDPEVYSSMALAVNPYGDGSAAPMIVDILINQC